MKVDVVINKLGVSIFFLKRWLLKHETAGSFGIQESLDFWVCSCCEGPGGSAVSKVFFDFFLGLSLNYCFPKRLGKFWSIFQNNQMVSSLYSTFRDTFFQVQNPRKCTVQKKAGPPEQRG